MTAFTEKLDRAAGAALCQGLQDAGGALIGAGAVSLVFGGAGVVPIALGMASYMAAAGGCNWDPNKEPPGQEKEGRVGGCLEVAVRAEVIWVGDGPNQPASPPLTWRRLDSAIFTGVDENGDSLYTISGINGNGTPASLSNSKVGKQYEPGYFSLNSGPDNPCGKAKEIPEIDPIDYTDPEDGCQLIVNWQGMSTNETGGLNPVFKIEAAPTPTLFEDGRDYPTTGDCNFQPVLYTGGPGGPGEPPIVTPWQPGWDDPFDGEPPWADLLREIAAGIAGNVISNELANLLATPYPPAVYKLFSQCEVDEDGQPQQRVIEIKIPAIKGGQAIVSRIDALIPLLQGQKDFKQPVCPPPKPYGEFRTIGFISEEVSPNGKSCLRKRLRYRSLSGLGLDSVIDWWKDFQFNAGPVTVKHRGSSWGTITVWAASADEGKRVIRHAAGEAGIDADQTGRWEISGSSSSRLGMPGTMKVNQTGGYYWITARDGSDNRPLVGKT